MDEMEQRFQKMETKVGELDKYVGIFNEIIKRFDITLNKLSDSMDKFDDAVGSLNTSMINLQNETKSNSEKIDRLSKNVDCLDNKGKFDWGSFVSSKLIPFLLGAGVIYAILGIVKEII